LGANFALEGLSQAEEEVEVIGLAYVLIGGYDRLRVVEVYGKDRGIQVVAEVQANGAGRRMVAQTGSNCMGEVVEAAGPLLAG
jgi:hypothetical protein